MVALISSRIDSQFATRLATIADAPAVRSLLHRAYRELADRGLNFTASYQDDEETRRHIAERKVHLLLGPIDAIDPSAIVGTISTRDENWFTHRRSAYIGKLAVEPALARHGLGTALMNHVERLAIADGYESLQLDTAKPATHLVRWYQRLGFEIIGETRFEGKTYESWIFEKRIDRATQG